MSRKYTKIWYIILCHFEYKSIVDTVRYPDTTGNKYVIFLKILKQTTSLISIKGHNSVEMQ